MRILPVGFLFALITFSSSYAADIYNGTLIDAHSQRGPEISARNVSEQINKSDVDFTLLSFRGGRPKDLKPTQTFLAIDKLTKNKVRYLLPTKLAGHARGAQLRGVMNRLKRFKNKATENKIDYAGYGEILVQHAPHNNQKLEWHGVNYDLKNEGILKIIDFIIQDDKPIILHIELNDYENDSKKILNQLIKLSSRHPKNNFLLIHMGQVEFSEAERIINNTENIHFITSLADNETEMRMRRHHAGHSQAGFINLFEKDDSLQQRWANLMNRHPKRFILALDRVFAGDWFNYKEKIYLWRKALAKLDETAASLIACGNSNKYFKLEIDCRAKRKP